MARMVKCKYCGYKFERVGKVFKQGTRYVCWSCGRKYNRNVEKYNRNIGKLKSAISKYNREVRKYNRVLKTGMKQTYFSMVLKIMFGAFLIYSVFDDKTADLQTLGCVIIVGILLILWGIIPFLRRKKLKARYQNALD